MNCPQCGAPLKKGKCEYCGYDVSDELQPNNNIPFNININLTNAQTPFETQNNNYATPKFDDNPNISNCFKSVTLFLCLIFGYMGVHRFYTGKIFSGILYLFTFGIFGIGIVIDLISIASGTFKDSEGKQLK